MPFVTGALLSTLLNAISYRRAPLSTLLRVISYRGALLSTLLHAAVYMFIHNLLNALVQIANKMGLHKKILGLASLRNFRVKCEACRAQNGQGSTVHIPRRLWCAIGRQRVVG
jgi:hypothetical protein